MQRSRHDDPEVSLRLSLLDAQVLDPDDLPVGRVDDLELEQNGDEVTVTAVLLGQQHLGPRVGGITGRFLTWSARRLADPIQDGRVESGDIASWSGMPTLRRRLADLPVAGLEKALAAVVRHVPGADDAGL